MSAKLLSDIKPKLGQVVIVENQKRHPRAKGAYHVVKVFDVNGKEIYLGMTERMYNAAKHIAKRNPEDMPAVSWFQDKVVESIQKRI